MSYSHFSQDRRTIKFSEFSTGSGVVSFSSREYATLFNPTNEIAIQNLIIKTLRDYGALVFRMRNVPTPIRRGKAIVGFRKADSANAGMADLLVVLPPSGEHYWVECKSAKGQQRDDQLIFQRRIEGAGGRYIIARSWLDVERAIGAEKLIYARSHPKINL